MQISDQAITRAWKVSQLTSQSKFVGTYSGTLHNILYLEKTPTTTGFFDLKPSLVPPSAELYSVAMSTNNFIHGAQVLVEYFGTLVVAGALKNANQNDFTPFFAKIQQDTTTGSFTGTTSIYQGGASSQFYSQTGVDIL